MKRIITLILTLLLVFCATACEATISSANPTYPAPWCINQTEDSVNTAYEKSVYAITKTDKFAFRLRYVAPRTRDSAERRKNRQQKNMPLRHFNYSFDLLRWSQ